MTESGDRFSSTSPYPLCGVAKGAGRRVTRLVSAAAQIPRVNDAAVPDIIATSESSTLRRSRIKGGGASSSFASLDVPQPSGNGATGGGFRLSAAQESDARASRRNMIASIATCGAPPASCGVAQSFAARS